MYETFLCHKIFNHRALLISRNLYFIISIVSGYLSLSNCRFFVLDEADGLLKQGYTELIERLHKQMPKITSDGRRLQMIVCSATLHAFEVKKMAVSISVYDRHLILLSG